MVDEYQDTDKMQEKLIHEISEKTKSLCVVGDDHQSIYSFRGATCDNIYLFAHKYPNTILIKLEQNYRSQKNIINTINKISNNIEVGYKKELHSEIQSEEYPTLQKFDNEHDEAQYIAKKIQPNTAILSRNIYNTNTIQAYLMKEKRSYTLSGGVKFAEKANIKDIIAYIKVIINRKDTIAWFRILKKEKGVGAIYATNTIREIENGEKLSKITIKDKITFAKLADTLNEMREIKEIDQKNRNN